MKAIQVTKYEARDGDVFDTPDAAEAHEAELDRIEKIAQFVDGKPVVGFWDKPRVIALLVDWERVRSEPILTTGPTSSEFAEVYPIACGRIKELGGAPFTFRQLLVSCAHHRAADRPDLYEGSESLFESWSPMLRNKLLREGVMRKADGPATRPVRYIRAEGLKC